MAVDSFGEAVPPQVVAPRDTAVGDTVEEWTYNPGYGQFMITLRFESAGLVPITYGDQSW